MPHEYCEFRWAEVIGAPEPPEHQRVAGWQVHYPFDGRVEESEKGGIIFNDRVRVQLALIAIFGLATHTIRAASLDLNTDSNTRQRDLCTLDAFLATRYQGSVGPATSFHRRRRVTEIMFEANGYVNYWTEFLVSHVGALAEYTAEYTGLTIARKVWNASFSVPLIGKDEPGVPELFSMKNYTLEAYYYYDPGSGLVRRTPRPLIDWPRSDQIDTDDQRSSYCDDMCVQMNAYAVKAHQWAAEIAARLGLIQEAFKYDTIAHSMRTRADDAFRSRVCDPPGASLCYKDSLETNETTATASVLAAFARLEGTAAGVLELVPFLRARNGRRGPEHGVEISGWMAGFMLEAILSAAGEVDEGLRSLPY